MTESNWVTYAGNWRIEDTTETYQGELHVNNKEHIITLVVIITNESGKLFAKSFPHIGKIKFIQGRLFSGAEVLLYRCNTGRGTLGYSTTQNIHAEYAFWGLKVDHLKDIRFKKAMFDFGEIIEWSGLCKYKGEWLDETKTAGYVWEKEPTCSIMLDENTRVSFIPQQGSIRSLIFDSSYEIKQIIGVQICYDSPTDWDVIITDAEKIKQLIVIGMQRFVHTKSIKYYHSSIDISLPETTNGVRTIEQAGDVLCGIDYVEHSLTGYDNNFLFSLQEISNCSPLKQWSQTHEKLHPILNLYCLLFRTINNANEIAFLNLAQALETYHARYVTDDFSKYCEHVENVLNVIYSNQSSNPMRQAWSDFLLPLDIETRKYSQIPFKCRIADLFFADGAFIFWPTKYKLIDLVDKIVATRNYYTHYNEKNREKAFSDMELPWAIFWTKLVLDYHILLTLGLDKTNVTKMIQERQREFEMYYSLSENPIAKHQPTTESDNVSLSKQSE